MIDRPRAELDWTAEGAPRSQVFDDIYFSRDGGLDEARAVFLTGCGLPEAWTTGIGAGRRNFTVAETGFGTGLNILALLDLWSRTKPQGGRLSIFSVEAYPMTRDEAARALSGWPELGDLAALMTARWPRRAPGLHRIDFPELDATFDLAIGEAAWGIGQWSGRADAWMLDGFAPAKNPQMWRDEVLQAIASRTAPGARLSTFTVAGHVRRGLEATGFAVSKKPGHGRKRERLEAIWPGERPTEATLPRTAIIGGGIAGASLARALMAQGLRPIVIDADAGDAASANPAALVTPALDAGGGTRAGFYAQAFARAVDLYEALDGAVIGKGVEQLAKAERDPARFATVMAGGVFAEGALTATDGGLMFEEGLAVRPPVVTEAWLEGSQRVTGRVTRLERVGDAWQVLGEDSVLAEADLVFVAAGIGSGALLGHEDALKPVRGQASWAEGLTLDHALAWGGYAIPMDGAVLFGATHDRGRTDTDVLAEDHERNLKTLAQALPDLADQAAKGPIQGRAAIRATTFDRMPVAGPTQLPGVYLLGGLGSRGFCTAPVLGEHLAALALDLPSPLPRAFQDLMVTTRL